MVKNHVKTKARKASLGDKLCALSSLAGHSLLLSDVDQIVLRSPGLSVVG